MILGYRSKVHTELGEGKLNSWRCVSQRVMWEMTWEKYMVVIFCKKNPSKTSLKLDCEPTWYVVQNLHNSRLICTDWQILFTS